MSKRVSLSSKRVPPQHTCPPVEVADSGRIRIGAVARCPNLPQHSSDTAYSNTSDAGKIAN